MVPKSYLSFYAIMDEVGDVEIESSSDATAEAAALPTQNAPVLRIGTESTLLWNSPATFPAGLYSATTITLPAGMI